MNKSIILVSVMIYFYSLFGFYYFNHRNHSELAWQQLETDNIIIVYHDPLKEEALQSAGIAQETYNALVKTYDLELEDKVKIYISDQDEIINGYSMMGDHIVLWVRQNDFVTHFTGKTKWLRRVISHEMSHHFVAHSIKNWLDLLFPYSAIQFPSDFNEGYAMFFSGEPWGYNREDAALRRGVFSNDLKYETTPGYHYTVGFSMVRYLHTFYGEKKLIELLKHRNKLKIYDFKEAFNEVYGKKFEVFKEEWRRYIYTYYFGEAYKQKTDLLDDSTKSNTLNALTVLSKPWHKISSIVMKNDKVLIFGQKYDKQLYNDIYVAEVEKDSISQKKLCFKEQQEIKKLGGASNLDISENGKFVVFNRYQRFENGSYQKAVYLYDTEKKKLKFLNKGNLVKVSNEGKVYYHHLNDVCNEIGSIDKDGKREILFKFEESSQIGHLLLSPQQDKLLLTRYDSDRKFMLEMYDIGLKKKIYEKEWQFMPKNLIWQNDKILLTVESGRDYRSRVVVMNSDNYEWQEYKTPPFNINPFKIVECSDSTGLKLMVVGELLRKDNPIGLITLAEKNQKKENDKEKVIDNYFTRWITTEYENKIDDNPKPAESIIKSGNYNSFNNLFSPANLALPLEEGIMFASLWMEPLSKHTLNIGGYVPYDFNLNKGWYGVNYTNLCFYPEININYLQYKWIGGLIDEEPFYTKIRNLSLSAVFPVNFISEPFWYFNYGLGIDYLDVEEYDNDFDYPNTFEKGVGATGRLNVAFGYDLPVQNSQYHPVKRINFSYEISGADKKIGMKHSYTHNLLAAQIGYSPTQSLFGSSFFTFINKLNYEWQNGKFLIQNNPGIDEYKNIPIEKLMNNRSYVRGFEETVVGDELFLSKNEGWIKISDNFDSLFSIVPSILKIGYLGLGGFSDYATVYQKEQRKEYKSYGWEVKSVISILGIATEQKFGQAYDYDGKKLGKYYQVTIPFSLK